MKVVLIIAALGLAAGPATANQARQSKDRPVRLAQAKMTCFKSGEESSGMNKICYYDCMGSRAAITISATSLCPLSIQK